MGWGRLLLMGNVGQQLDIGDLNHEIAGIQSSVAENLQMDREQGRSTELLQRENQELSWT